MRWERSPTPAATPKSVTERLNQDIVRALNRADVKDKLLNTGVEAVASSADQLTLRVKAEMSRMG